MMKQAIRETTVLAILLCSSHSCLRAQEEVAQNEGQEKGRLDVVGVIDQESPTDVYLRSTLVTDDVIAPTAQLAWTAAIPHGTVSEAKCSACHAASDEQSKTKLDAVATGYDLALASHDGNYMWYRSFDEPVAAMQLGKYTIQRLNDDVLRGHLKLTGKPALLVQGTMLEDSVLKRGDILLTMDDEPVKDPIQLSALLVKKRDEEDRRELVIGAIRGGELTRLKVMLRHLTPEREPFRIGVHLDAPSEALRSQLSLYENEGVIVTRVVEDSPAMLAGIKLHDILLRAEGERLATQEDLREVIQASEGKAIEIVLMRAGEEIKLPVTPKREEPELAVVACPVYTGSTQQSARLRQLYLDGLHQTYWEFDSAQAVDGTKGSDQEASESTSDAKQATSDK